MEGEFSNLEQYVTVIAAKEREIKENLNEDIEEMPSKKHYKNINTESEDVEHMFNIADNINKLRKRKGKVYRNWKRQLDDHITS